MKTIFLITRNFPPTICGVGDYSFQLYSRLKLLGYSLKVITQASSDLRAISKTNGYELDIIESPNFRVFRCIKREVLNGSSNIVIFQYVPNSLSHFSLPFYLIPLTLWLRIKGVRVAYFFHEVSLRVFHNGLKYFLFSISQRALASALVLLSNFSFTSTKRYQSYFWPIKPELVPIPANLITNQEWRQTRKEFNTHSLIISSFANRCSPEVIHALNYCKQNGLKFDFKIIGSATPNFITEIRRNLEALDFLNVEWHIGKSTIELVEVLNSTDVFLHIESVSKYKEGGVSSKSGVLAAAMAAGIPIIASKGDLTDESLYQNNQSIILVDQVSHKTVAEAILRLSSNIDLMNALSIKAIETYSTKLSWINTISQYQKHLNVGA